MRSLLVFLAVAGTQPAYATHFLPGMLLTGTGVGLSFSGFGSAAVAELPRNRFATGSAISATSRQIGAVIGIALLFAIFDNNHSPDPMARFHSAWLMMAATGMAAGVIAIGLGRVRAREVAPLEDAGRGEVELAKSTPQNAPAAS